MPPCIDTVSVIHLQFPYPILNTLPFPHGLLGMSAAALLLILAWFQLGSIARKIVRRMVALRIPKEKKDA